MKSATLSKERFGNQASLDTELGLIFLTIRKQILAFDAQLSRLDARADTSQLRRIEDKKTKIARELMADRPDFDKINSWIKKMDETTRILERQNPSKDTGGLGLKVAGAVIGGMMGGPMTGGTVTANIAGKATSKAVRITGKAVKGMMSKRREKTVPHAQAAQNQSTDSPQGRLNQSTDSTQGRFDDHRDLLIARNDLDYIYGSPVMASDGNVYRTGGVMGIASGIHY